MLVGKGGWGERRREKLPPSCTLESLKIVCWNQNTLKKGLQSWIDGRKGVLKGRERRKPKVVYFGRSFHSILKPNTTTKNLVVNNFNSESSKKEFQFSRNQSRFENKSKVRERSKNDCR